MKLNSITAGLAIIGFISASNISQAFADDIADPAGCTVMGLVEGGGLYNGQDSDVSLGGPQIAAKSNWKSGIGEGALGFSCNNWNVQADAALYGSWASITLVPPPTDFNLKDIRGHIGGAAFWRDPQSLALGVSGSWISQNYDISSSPAVPPFSGSGTGNVWRIGAFAEFYASDYLTLGASAHYFNGSLANGGVIGGVQLDQFGFEFAAIAKLYPTDNLSLTARADALRGTFRVANTANDEFNGYALSLEGEYLIPESQFSIFAGGRYADRLITILAPVHMDFQDTQIYAGVKFAFGGAAPTSIAARDRSKTYDNTSVFLEKLPSISGSIHNTFLNAIAAGP